MMYLAHDSVCVVHVGGCRWDTLVMQQCCVPVPEPTVYTFMITSPEYTLHTAINFKITILEWQTLT